ncbi:MAG: hypothetical protein KDI01_08070 [Halioglobus sp.]|nr:hypothetical protein [Halioglobus sp.]
MLRSILFVVVAASIAACSGGGNNNNNRENTAPVVSAIGDQTIEADTQTQPFDFSVDDDKTALDQLQITVTSDDDALVDESGLSVTGSGAARSLNVTPNPGQVGSVTLTLVVEDEMGLSSEQSFLLTIAPRMASFSSFVRTVFATGANEAPMPINSIEFDQDGMDFNDLLL